MNTDGTNRIATDGTTRIAIGCQGGGSHAAFTAGALETMLDWVEETNGYEIVALSGTSGGAMCAVLAWYSLLKNDPKLADELLTSFWHDVAATDPFDSFVNVTTVTSARFKERGFPMPEISPYENIYAKQAQDRLRRLLERSIDFDAIDTLYDETSPALAIGAVDITTNEFTVFDGTEVRPDAVLASAALPELFPAIHFDGGIYWDGLLSENPPITALTDANPDEIWVIQLDPQIDKEEPRSLRNIRDRRNDLAGNLSLNQELRTVEKVNAMVDQGVITNDDYRHIDVRRLVMTRRLDYPSKLDRDPEFIDELIEHGRNKTAEFLEEHS